MMGKKVGDTGEDGRGYIEVARGSGPSLEQYIVSTIARLQYGWQPASLARLSSGLETKTTIPA